METLNSAGTRLTLWFGELNPRSVMAHSALVILPSPRAHEATQRDDVIIRQGRLTTSVGSLPYWSVSHSYMRDGKCEKGLAK